MQKFTVILPAAGRSIRFGGPHNKLQTLLGGKTVIRRSVEAFLGRDDVARIIIATAPPTTADPTPELPLQIEHPRVFFTAGGDSRAQSVYRALLEFHPGETWVAVHDAARPLVSQALIGRVFSAAQQFGAAVPALPVHLTIKQAVGPLPAQVRQTVPRDTLWAMQTPQVMRAADLRRAYAQCPLDLAQVTDDAQLLELIGLPVWLVAGEEQNLKITTQSDVRLAEHFLPDAQDSA